VSKVEHPGAVIPARPFLGVRQEDWGEINSAVLAFIGG
jgi:phage gpG-like protein